MICIFASWFIMFLFFLPMGVLTEKTLKISSQNLIFTLLLGLVSQTILLTFFAFFLSIGTEVFVLNCILTFFLILKFRDIILEKIRFFRCNYQNLSQSIRNVFLLIFLSSLFKCAQTPFILDNESYYIQTIKWLNQYGLVKGLGNLNIAFGQTSAWHILQSGFNFSFITNRLNDINGFLLVICSFFFLSVFDSNLNKEKSNRWIGFTIIFNVLMYQFINSPSPDLPVILISQIIFLLYLKDSSTASDLKILIILFIFLVFLKITIVPIGILLFFVGYKNRKLLPFLFFTMASIGMLWIIKNILLTGYPFFPLTNLPTSFDWKIPRVLLDSFNSMLKNHEYLAVKNYAHLSIWDKFYKWIGFGGINSIFNKGILFLFVIILGIREFRKKLKYQILYFTLLFHFILIFFFSPQFRFFLAEFIFFSCILISSISSGLKIRKNVIIYLFYGAAILPVFFIYIIDLKKITTNKFNQEPEKLKISELIIPEKNSKFSEIEFEKITEGNLNYYSPKYRFFFYGTADGPLPCTNTLIINHFKRKIHIAPQLRTNNIKDGFYSKKLPR